MSTIQLNLNDLALKLHKILFFSRYTQNNLNLSTTFFNLKKMYGFQLVKHTGDNFL